AHDLLQPPTLSETDGELDPLLLLERRHDRRRREGRRQVVGARLQRALTTCGDHEELKGELAADETLLEEEMPDIGVGRTGGHVEGDVLRAVAAGRSEEHTSELQSLAYLVCRLL